MNFKFFHINTSFVFKVIIILNVITFFSSCGSTKGTTNFVGLTDAKFEKNIEDLEPVLQKNDILSIQVSSPNKEATEIFNKSTSNLTPLSSNNVNAQAPGYLVDQEGNIRFPLLGVIKAAGLTKRELRDQIIEKLLSNGLLIDPIVDIRYLNYKVSILGEVTNPSVVVIPSEKVSLLEALALAGDLTIYAKRDNILLIRETDGVKEVKRLDLTSKDIFSSPYYYLKSNDIIYVESNKSKVINSNGSLQKTAIVISGLTLAVIILANFL